MRSGQATVKNMQNSRYEIRIAGTGGQGVILAGIMLAEAAILSGKYVVQSQTYGAAVRGGKSVSEVIISDVEVDYPHALELDILVALTQKACDQNLLDLKEEGILIVDSQLVRRAIWSRVANIPLQQIASDAGETRAFNMAALGAIASFYPEVSRDSLAKIMENRLPPAKVKANILAFDEAIKFTQSLKDKLKYTDIEEELET